jgi:hypothetical protein
VTDITFNRAMHAADDDRPGISTSNEPHMTANVRQLAEGMARSSNSIPVRLRAVNSTGEEITHHADKLQTTSEHIPPFLSRRPPSIEQKPSSVIGQPGMPEPAANPKGPKLKFKPEEDALLFELKRRRS